MQEGPPSAQNPNKNYINEFFFTLVSVPSSKSETGSQLNRGCFLPDHFRFTHCSTLIAGVASQTSLGCRNLRDNIGNSHALDLRSSGSNDNPLPTFRDNVSVSSSNVKKSKRTS